MQKKINSEIFLQSNLFSHNPHFYYFLSSAVDKLVFLEDQDWNDFLQQVCSQIDSTEKSTGASRAKLNLLCYLCVVAGHREVATRLLHSPLVGS